MLAQYRKAARIIVVSEFSRRELLDCLDLDPARIVVIGNGVDSDFSGIVRKPDYAQPCILAVGTIEKRKNLAVIIRALAAMDNRRVRLVVPGPATPYREECERLAQDLGVRDRLDLLGYVSRPKLLRLYATASIAVVPSKYEGFGYGAAQALVAGVPVIVANVTALPEIVGDWALKLDPDATDTWATALDAHFEREREQQVYAESVRSLAQQKWSWQRAAQQTVAVYHSIPKV